MEVVLLWRAEADSQKIYNKLEDFQEGRGEVFLASVDRALIQLGIFPKSAPVIRHPFRRILLRGFPYGLVYSIEAGRIMVHVIAPLRGDPERLKAILDDPES